MNKAGWFLTKQGMIFTRSVVLATSTGSFIGYLGLHTYFLDNYRKIFQFYSSGWEKPLSAEIQQLANDVLKECTLTEKERKAIKFFAVCGFDTFHAGSTELKTGGIVGIPNHFNYKELDDIEKPSIRLLNNTQVRWSTKPGQDLADSLILSQKAQKFAIARDIHYCTTNYVYAYGLAASMFIITSYLLGNGIAVKFNLYRLHRKIRTPVYMLCGTLGLLVFYMTKDALSQYWDKYADRTASQTSSDYLEGGIEYYEKSLKRNVAMRTLLGKYGEKVFTYHGNKRTFIRTTSLPLTVRLDNLKMLMKEREYKLTDINNVQEIV